MITYPRDKDVLVHRFDCFLCDISCDYIPTTNYERIELFTKIFTNDQKADKFLWYIDRLIATGVIDVGIPK